MKLHIGDRIYAENINQTIIITQINNDTEWYFKKYNDDRVEKSLIPLSEFETTGIVYSKINSDPHIKYLDRYTACVLFEIFTPIWNGGRKVVGLNLSRIKKHNEIHFMYKRKSDGQLSLPDNYYFDGDLVKQLDYKLMNTKGTTLVLIPFKDLLILKRR